MEVQGGAVTSPWPGVVVFVVVLSVDLTVGQVAGREGVGGRGLPALTLAFSKKITFGVCTQPGQGGVFKLTHPGQHFRVMCSFNENTGVVQTQGRTE